MSGRHRLSVFRISVTLQKGEGVDGGKAEGHLFYEKSYAKVLLKDGRLSSDCSLSS
jgi:hypothetical protein